MTELDWNTDLSNPYYRSKILSERQAWEVAVQHDLWMVSILPSAMIGPHAYALTDTMSFIEQVRKKQIPLNPNFHFNFIDVRDVAEAAISAANNGISGERYILANTQSSGLDTIINAANVIKSGYSVPPQAPKWLLMCVAWLEEQKAKITGKRANLTMSQVRLFYGCRQEYNVNKAHTKLNFKPKAPEKALEETFAYLANR